MFVNHQDLYEHTALILPYPFRLQIVHAGDPRDRRRRAHHVQVALRRLAGQGPGKDGRKEGRVTTACTVPTRLW